MLEGLRKPEEVILLVVILLSYGCPPQAIVHAFGLDERTVARWQKRAGNHCQRIHQALVMQGQLDLEHVQADEIRGKGYQMVPWIAMAIMVSTRLWLGGAVSLSRDRHLADQLMRIVKACCQPLAALLVLTDGWAAYPNSIRRAFREKVKRTSGRGRCALQAWPEIFIGTVIKKTAKKRVVEVIRCMTQGTRERAAEVLQRTWGGEELNTAFIERFNGTKRERLASLTRRCRHAAHRLDLLEAGMWLVGCTSNLCWPHHELSRREAKAQGKRGEIPITPARASGLTDHIWSVQELLWSRVAPAPWVAPQRRGRPPKASAPSHQTGCKRTKPLVCLRKGALCLSTI
jgi:IS1 family transposase